MKKYKNKSDKQDYVKKAQEGSLYKFRRHNRIDGGKKKKVKHVKLIIDEQERESATWG